MRRCSETILACLVLSDQPHEESIVEGYPVEGV